MSTAAPSVPAPSYRTTSRTRSEVSFPAASIAIWSPRAADNFSAALSFRNTSPAPRSDGEPGRVSPLITPNPANCAASAAKSVTRGSFCLLVTSCMATGSTMAGATASTSFEPAAAVATVANRSSGKYAVSAVCPTATALACAPFTPTDSSVLPSVRTTDDLMVDAIVSPVLSADAMMAVPSMSPTTMMAVRARRRPTLRRPSLKKTRFRSASAATTPTETARSSVTTTARVATGAPSKRSIVLSPRRAPGCRRRRPRSAHDREVLGRTSRISRARRS